MDTSWPTELKIYRYINYNIFNVITKKLYFPELGQLTGIYDVYFGLRTMNMLLKVLYEFV